MLISYIVFNVLNVIIQTVKSIVTIKCNKYVASIVNAVAYGLYTYIIVLTNADLNLWFKIIVVALANLVGVFVVKLIEEKGRKDRLWKIEATITDLNCYYQLHEQKIPCNCLHTTDKWYIVNCFCETQEQSAKAKKILEIYNAKYFVSESKTL